MKDGRTTKTTKKSEERKGKYRKATPHDQTVPPQGFSHLGFA